MDKKGFGFLGLLITLAIVGYLIYMAIDYYSQDVETATQYISTQPQNSSNKASGKPRGTIVNNVRNQVNTMKAKHLNDMRKAMQ